MDPCHRRHALAKPPPAGDAGAGEIRRTLAAAIVQQLFMNKAPLYLLLVFWGAILARAEPSIAELRVKDEGGDVKAQLLLASDFDHGRGVQQDYAEAAHWYGKAAAAGDPIAQNNLGSLYQNGLGVMKDYAKAVELYRRSAEQGFPMAENSLGMMYDLGLGVTQDRETGNSWYRKAIEHGVPEAMLNLGLNYHDGSGVSKDLIEAFKWIDLARFFTQHSGDMNTKWKIRGILDELKKALSRTQIKEGERRSHDWYEAYRQKNGK
jgi:TPR repeat protein